MTDEELVERGDANYFASMRTLAVAMEGGELREGGGLLIAATALPVAFFNVAFLTQPPADRLAALRSAVDYFDGRGLPFIVRLRDGLDPDAERAALSLALIEGDTVPGMVLSPLPPAAPPPSPLEVRRVADAATLARYSEVLAAGFGMPQEFGRRMATPELLRIADLALYLGYLDGRPVATSALFISHRVAGVYNVATLEPYRRRGLGEAMTRHAVQEGADAGCLLAGLQSSQMGFPVSQRMGFRALTGYKTFLRAEHMDEREG